MSSSSQSSSGFMLSTSAAMTTLVFGLSLTWFVKRKRREDKNSSNSSASSSLIMTAHGDNYDGNIISIRGASVLKPPIPYLSDFFKCLNDPYDLINNRRGYIALCMAENNLIHDLLKRRLVQASICKTAFSDDSVYSYNSFLGLPIAREAAAYFLAKRFYLCNNETHDDDDKENNKNTSKRRNFYRHKQDNLTPYEAMTHINPMNVAITSGCAGVLHSLCYALGEPDDIVLIPAPYYAGFENDIKAISRCIAFPVVMENMEVGPTKYDLNKALNEIKVKKLGRVRFLLITNPNNPLGVIYKPSIIKNAIEWARTHAIHTIVDEIFALSTHKKFGHGFQSVIKVLDNKLNNDVHMIWALSKDFGASGFRIGVLYTQNQILLESLANLNIFSGVSHPMQMIMAEILTDDKFVDDFLDESRERLRTSYELCTKKLQEMVVPYIHASAGMFVYIDLSSLLPTKKSFDGERQLTDLIVEYCHLVLTPGENQRDVKPGRFRLCYSWITTSTLHIAMERLSKFVIKIRKIGCTGGIGDGSEWDHINASSLSSIID